MKILLLLNAVPFLSIKSFPEGHFIIQQCSLPGWYMAPVKWLHLYCMIDGWLGQCWVHPFLPTQQSSAPSYFFQECTVPAPYLKSLLLWSFYKPPSTWPFNECSKANQGFTKLTFLIELPKFIFVDVALLLLCQAKDSNENEGHFHFLDESLPWQAAPLHRFHQKLWGWVGAGRE